MKRTFTYAGRRSRDRRWSGYALSFGLAAALAAHLPPARALESDRNAPTQVESDRMEYDDLQQVNVFTGNVILTRGTIRLSAQRLLVRQDPQGFHFASATGTPARFRQKRDEPGDQWVEGEAMKIDYDGKAETVRLRDAAMLRRTSDGHPIDEIHGTDIRYESRTGFFNVQGGGASSAATADNPAGRVRVVIQPRETGKDANGAGARPAPTQPLQPPDPAPLTPDEHLRIPARPGTAR